MNEEERKVKQREYARRYYYKYLEKNRARGRDYHRKHFREDTERAKINNARPEVKERKRIFARNKARQAKHQIMEHYGGNPPKCQCCGESIYEFLQLDHINGGGNQQRKRLKLSSGSSFYLWIIRNKYPGGYQVLYANCNLAKYILGHCPHQSLSR